jgi:hypothetical protein
MIVFGHQVCDFDNYKTVARFTESGLEMLVVTHSTGNDEQFFKAMDVYHNRTQGEYHKDSRGGSTPPAAQRGVFRH